MALPTTIMARAADPGRNPVHKAPNGAFYYIGVASGGAFEAFKATDPSDSWSSVITGGQSDPHESVNTVLDGDIIHIISSHDTTTQGQHLLWTRFDTDSELFFASQSIDVLDNDPTFPWCSLGEPRSDGDLIVAYAGDTDQVMGGKKERVDYARLEGGSWTAGIALDAGGDIHYGSPCVVKDSGTDKHHFIWAVTTSTADPPVVWVDVEARSLSSTNTLSTTVSDTIYTDNLASPRVEVPEFRGVSFDNGGTENMRFVYRRSESSPGPRGMAIMCDADGSGDIRFEGTAETEFASTTAQPSTVQLFSHTHPIMEIVYESGTGDIHVLYSNFDDSNDIYHVESTDTGDTWGTETEELDGVNCQQLAATIYDRGGNTVLAYVYDDAGTTKYNEIVLATGADDIAPTGIASAEAFGTATIGRGAVDVAPTGIASAEAFGSPTVAFMSEVEPTGIASAEAFGSPTITTTADIAPTGITSGEAFGTATVAPGAVDVSPTGIASAETFGTATLTSVADINPTGIASAEAFGTTVVAPGAVDISPGGIASSEAFGSHTVALEAAQDIAPTGIASAEAFGTALITIDVAPTGITSDEAFGTPVLTTTADISPTGIASAEAFGNPTVAPGAVDIAPTGILSAEAFGTALITLDVTPTGIGSAEAFGNPTIGVGAVDISPTGIVSEEAFGTATITSVADINPTGITSDEAFGTAVVTSVADISPTGIPSGELFGNATITPGVVDISPTGIASAEAFGNASVTNDAQPLFPTGIASAEAFGTPTIGVGAVDVNPTGIPSEETFGNATIGLEVSPTGIASEEAFGTPSVASVADIVPSSIASAEAFGTATVAGGVSKEIPIEGQDEYIINTNNGSVTLYFAKGKREYFVID